MYLKSFEMDKTLQKRQAVVQWNEDIRYQKVIRNGKNFYRFWVRMKILLALGDPGWRYVTSVDDFLLGLKIAEEQVGRWSV